MEAKRLSIEAFKIIMEKLRTDEEFRKAFLSDDPKQAAPWLQDVLTEEDLQVLPGLKWDERLKHVHSIDEKLVLASSSGY